MRPSKKEHLNGGAVCCYSGICFGISSHPTPRTLIRRGFNSLTAHSVLAGEKHELFGKYVLISYVGIVHYILHETKTWHTKIYLPTQRTNRQILPSAKKIQFCPSTQVIDAASFVNITSNIGQAEVIACSTCYQTL